MKVWIKMKTKVTIDGLPGVFSKWFRLSRKIAWVEAGWGISDIMQMAGTFQRDSNWSYCKERRVIYEKNNTVEVNKKFDRRWQFHCRAWATLHYMQNLFPEFSVWLGVRYTDCWKRLTTCRNILWQTRKKSRLNCNSRNTCKLFIWIPWRYNPSLGRSI